MNLRLALSVTSAGEVFRETFPRAHKSLSNKTCSQATNVAHVSRASSRDTRLLRTLRITRNEYTSRIRTPPAEESGGAARERGRTV